MTQAEVARGGQTLTDAVARRLRGQLAEKRITGLRLAELTGMGRAMVSRRLNGDTALNTDELELIEQVTGISVVYLLTGYHVEPDGPEPVSESPLSGLNRRPFAYKDVLSRIGAGQGLVIPMPEPDRNVIPFRAPAAIPLASELAPVVSLRPRTIVRTAHKRVVFESFEQKVA
jgi:transcriptional regulator with XRE-family HTH domain